MYVPILLKRSEYVEVIKITLKEGTPPRISNETRINIKTTLQRGTRKCNRSNVVPLLIVNVKIFLYVHSVISICNNLDW